MVHDGDAHLRRLTPLILLACLAGCGATDPTGLPALDARGSRIGGSYQHRAQVLRDVTAIIEGMEGARVSRLRRAGP